MSVYSSISGEGSPAPADASADQLSLGRGSLVHDLVQERAIEDPNAIAVSQGTRKLTYGELWRWSTGIAARLAGLGVAADQVVGVLLDRSPEAIAGMLGILRSGAAYLPLDPAMPAERLSYVLQDSGVQYVVTNRLFCSRLAGTAVKILEIESIGTESAPAATAFPISLQNLAYVIYTSGSSGGPKGVEITHEGLANLIRWHCRNFNVTAADRAAHMANIGFDAAVWEVWPYLAAGSSLHIPEASIRSNPNSIRNWILANAITIAFLPTAIAEPVMALDWPASTSLRVLLTGADTLHRRPRASLPFTVVNNYGPTESTVVATSGVVRPAEIEDSVPSIGSPIAGIDLRIFDERMREVPRGEIGEIYLGGSGMARGYRNRPDLTAKSFLTLAFEGASKRLYRTGDLGRFRADGQLEFLGRTDEQVKIRGHRVEPSEIVRALQLHPSVQNAAVIARTEADGDKRIYAYVVDRPGQTVTVANLVSHLRTLLPEYMLPAGFIRMNALPLNQNGKIDRAVLPEPNSMNLLRDDDFASPSNVIEARVAAVLCELLNLESVSRTDNFFFLGGHSLLGTQLITRIEELFDVQLSLLTLFDHPTVAGIAEQIERHILVKLGAEAPSGIPQGDVQNQAQEGIS